MGMLQERPLPFTSVVVLSLMQQLTIKLEENTDLKLAYLIEAVQALRTAPEDSSAKKYVPKYVSAAPCADAVLCHMQGVGLPDCQIACWSFPNFSARRP